MLVGLGPAWRREIPFYPQNPTGPLQLPGPQQEAAVPTLLSSQGTREYVEDQQDLPRLEIRPSPGQGVGLFAVDNIPAYTKILEDDALISLAKAEDLPQLWEKYCLLPSDFKQIYDELSFPTQQAEKEEALIFKLRARGYDGDEGKQMARVSSKFQANAFKTSLSQPDNRSDLRYHLSKGLSYEKDTWAYALFPTVARINHSCTPNAHAHYRPSIGGEVVYSLTDISADTEIRISYFDITMARTDRQARATSWGFTCDCPACSRPSSFGYHGYGEILKQIHCSLAPEMMITKTPSIAERLQAEVQVSIDLACSTEYKWLVVALPNLYQALSVLEMIAGSNERACQTMERALRWERIITGNNSPSSLEKVQSLRKLQNSTQQVA